MNQGHSFDHALQVGQIGFLIVENAQDAKLAGAAGLCHNADRMLQKSTPDGKSSISDIAVEEMVEGWLVESHEFAQADRPRIIEAVLRHSEPNLENSDCILIALQDADRVANAMADTIIRAGQFRPDIPTIDPRMIGGDSTDRDYKNPRSIARDLTYRRTWIDPSSPYCVRLPKAKELMDRRVRFINSYLQEIEDQRKEIGFWPDYPFA